MAQAAEETVYRDYLSECVRMLTETNARIGTGPYMTLRCRDLLHPASEKTETGEEVKNRILNKLKGGGA